MTEPTQKDKSPNKDIDKAIKKLMKDMEAEGAAPDEIKAKVAVLQLAVKWEGVKHNIKDGEEWNPDSI